MHKLDYEKLERSEFLRGLQVATPGVGRCRVVSRCSCDDEREVTLVVEEEGVTFGGVFDGIALKRTCGCRSMGRIWIRGQWSGG